MFADDAERREQQQRHVETADKFAEIVLSDAAAEHRRGSGVLYGDGSESVGDGAAPSSGVAAAAAAADSIAGAARPATRSSTASPNATIPSGETVGLAAIPPPFSI